MCCHCLQVSSDFTLSFTHLGNCPVEVCRLVLGVVCDGLTEVGQGLLELSHVEIHICCIEICQGIGRVQFKGLLVVSHRIHTVVHELIRRENKVVSFQQVEL